jgi:hypothetical protein
LLFSAVEEKFGGFTLVRNLLKGSGRLLSACFERETNPCGYKISLASIWPLLA